MKTLQSFVVGALLTGASSLVLAQQAWLVVNQEHYSLVRTANNSLATVADLGDSLTSYGESPQAMAFISRNASVKKFVLTVVDKKSAQVLLTRQLDGFLATQMAGAREDLVLDGTYVYFNTLRLTAAHQIVPNDLGGSFDFNRMKLADGSLLTLSLPRECDNPRLVNFGGIPLVYSWNDYRVWKFDPTASVLTQVITGHDVGEILGAEKTAERQGKLKEQAFADDVEVPGTGVFRLSRLGALDKILDASLSPVAVPRPTLDLGLDAPAARLFRGTFNDNPAIIVLGQLAGNPTLMFIDPRTLTLEWKTSVSSGLEPWSILAQPRNSVTYVDKSDGTIDRISVAGTSVIWKLSGLGPDIDPTHVQLVRLIGSD